MDDAEARALAVAVRNARRAAILAMIVVLVALAILAIDNGIKKEVVTRALEARRTLDEFAILAKEAASGAQEARQDRAGDSADLGSADGVVQPPGSSAADGNHAGSGMVPPRGRAGGRPGRPGGNG